MTYHQVSIWTDGSAKPNPGNGGFAALLVYGEHERVLTGGEKQTTNQRMELMAAVVALEALKRPCEVTIYTDSKYLKLGITDWIQKWKRNGWRTSAKHPVEHRDLWERLDAQVERHLQVTWEWTKGHAGNVNNERVDKLALTARLEQA
jgi:ribonuclease HI